MTNPTGDHLHQQHHQDPVVSANPSPLNRSRKVSIADGSHGHDNPAFESPSRKISACSEHANIGPVRKKSMLHKQHSELDCTSARNDSDRVNGDTRYKKQSTTDSVYSRTKYSDIDDDDDRSWWYKLFLKCRSEDKGLPSWSPSFWPKLCPHPYFPTYRQFSRIIALTLIGLLSWCILFSIVGSTAAPPDGKLYQLMLLSICAHFGGWLMSLTRLPALIGMLLMGMLLQNIRVVNIDASFEGICRELRNIALVNILIRAGLDLEPNTLRRLWFTVFKLGLGPWCVEALVVALLSVFFLKLPWIYAFLLGSVIAAVSPAVVVPCLIRLRSKGYGVAKGIPTLIIAVSGIDDAASVAIYGIIKSIIFSTSSLTVLIIEGPLSIVGGIIFGMMWGFICYYIPERNDPFVVPMRVLLLTAGGMASVFGSELVGYGGAGPLACVSCAFFSLVAWNKLGWEIEDNPVSTAFEIFWMIFEPILFGITGTSIKFDQLNGDLVYISAGIVVAAAIIRMFATALLSLGCKFNMKEKMFVSIAWMAKATVQAALAPVILGMSTPNSKEQDYGEKILTTCVLSIILTAPTGAILLTLLGPRLLTKTKFPLVTEAWRRSHRPSIKDISIIDEREEDQKNYGSLSDIVNAAKGDISIRSEA